MKTAVAKALFKSHDYHEFRKLVSDLLLEGKQPETINPRIWFFIPI